MCFELRIRTNSYIFGLPPEFMKDHLSDENGDQNKTTDSEDESFGDRNVFKPFHIRFRRPAPLREPRLFRELYAQGNSRIHPQWQYQNLCRFRANSPEGLYHHHRRTSRRQQHHLLLSRQQHMKKFVGFPSLEPLAAARRKHPAAIKSLSSRTERGSGIIVS